MTQGFNAFHKICTVLKVHTSYLSEILTEDVVKKTIANAENILQHSLKGFKILRDVLSSAIIIVLKAKPNLFFGIVP